MTRGRWPREYFPNVHIGIRPVTRQSAGGNVQYALTMMDALCAAGQPEDRFTVFSYARDPRPATPGACASRWDLRLLRIPPQVRIAEAIRARRKSRAQSDADLTPCRRPHLERALRRSGVELLLYPAPLAEAFETGLPFVAAIHDLQHLLHPEFPEVSADGEFEKREYLFRNIARRATLILADSEVGREDILHFYEAYGATADRVRVLPFLPANYLATDISESEIRRMLTAYDLPTRYLFYPANFWPHKNHVRIIEAIGKLKAEEGLAVHVVFTGSLDDRLARQTAAEVDEKARSLGIDAAVHRLGHVPNSDMSALYAGARGLVMPTFFGPTNIPVLEAWAFGCPVLTSDVRGIKEQVGDAAVLVSPESVVQLANGIRRLWTDEDLRQELAERGHRRLLEYGPHDFQRRLTAILSEAKSRASNQGQS